MWERNSGDTLLYAVDNVGAYTVGKALKLPLTAEEYGKLKALALKPAKDFLALYESIPDQALAAGTGRENFYGRVPRSAEEMYAHTKNVNAYYFEEIEADADNDGDRYAC